MIMLALALPTALLAEERNDTTITYNGKQFVIGNDSTETTVKVYDIQGAELRKTRETTYVDDQEIERVYVTSPFTPTSYSRNPFGMMQPTIWYGWQKTTSSRNGEWGHSEGLHTKDGGSFELGLTLGEMTIPLGRKKEYGLSLAIQTSYVRQYFQDNALPYNDGRHIGFTDISQTPAANNYLSYATARVPILLLIRHLESPMNHINKLQGGLGLALEYRGGANFHYMPGQFGDPINQHAKLYHWGVELTASLCIGPFKIISSYDLLPLFKTADGHKAFSGSIGFGITIGELFKKK